MDAAADPSVRQIVVVKSTQIGWSECLRNILGYWIDRDPGPTLAVMPDEKSAGELIEERIRPLLDSSPALRMHVTGRAWDVTKTVVRLTTMDLFVGWSGSPQSLASRPCRYVWFDEVDKYPPYSGREADPIRLGTERTATFGHRAKILIGSTPTDDGGAVAQAAAACDESRHYFVACPHCQHQQRLVFGLLRWPAAEDNEQGQAAHAATILRSGNAWIECAACAGRIDDRHKQDMLAAGSWRRADGSPCRPAISVCFRLSALYSPWRKFSQVAAEFLQSKGNAAALQNFTNSWLGETFAHEEMRPRGEEIKAAVDVAIEPRRAPDNYGALFATADTQTDRFYFVVRAWSYGMNSRLVHFGMASNWEDLIRATLEGQYQTDSGTPCRLHALLVDSGGDRTQEVYQFALAHRGLVFPTKGAASRNMRRPWFSSTITPKGVVDSVELRVFDTNFYKDMLARLLKADGKWRVHREITEDYRRQMTSEHKVIDRKTQQRAWQALSTGTPNHYWDCEVLQAAAADMAQISAWQPPAQKAPASQSPGAAPAAAPKIQRPAWLPGRDWMG